MRFWSYAFIYFLSCTQKQTYKHFYENYNNNNNNNIIIVRHDNTQSILYTYKGNGSGYSIFFINYKYNNIIITVITIMCIELYSLSL